MCIRIQTHGNKRESEDCMRVMDTKEKALTNVLLQTIGMRWAQTIPH